MKYIFIVLSFWSISNTFAQESDLSFQHTDIVWNHLTIDSTKIDTLPDGDILTGKNHLFIFDSFIHDDHLYSIARFAEIGALIEKIDINTGELLWKSFYDLSNNDEYEVPSSMYINTEGDLEILGFRNIQEDDPGYWVHSKIAIRTYDTDSGELLSYTYGDKSDASYNEMHTLGTLKKLKDDTYVYFLDSAIVVDGKLEYGFNVYSLDHIGKETDKKNVFYPKDYKKFSRRVLFKEDKFYHFLYFHTESGDSSSAYLRVFDQDLNIEKTVNMTGKLKHYDYSILTDMWEDKFEVVSYDLTNGNSQNLKLRFTYFDYEGNLLEELATPKTPFASEAHVRLANGNLFLAVTRPIGVNENTFWAIDCYQGDGNGALNLVKRLELADNNKFIKFNRALQIVGDKILFQMTYIEKVKMGESFSTDFEGVSFIMEADDLGIISGVEEYEDIEMLVDVFPNPSSHEFNIVFEKEIDAKIDVYCPDGKLLMDRYIYGKKQVVVDVRGWNSGVYNLRVRSKGKLGNYKIIKL